MRRDPADALRGVAFCVWCVGLPLAVCWIIMAALHRSPPPSFITPRYFGLLLLIGVPLMGGAPILLTRYPLPVRVALFIGYTIPIAVVTFVVASYISCRVHGDCL